MQFHKADIQLIVCSITWGIQAHILDCKVEIDLPVIWKVTYQVRQAPRETHLNTATSGGKFPYYFAQYGKHYLVSTFDIGLNPRLRRVLISWIKKIVNIWLWWIWQVYGVSGSRTISYSQLQMSRTESVVLQGVLAPGDKYDVCAL